MPSGKRARVALVSTGVLFIALQLALGVAVDTCLLDVRDPTYAEHLQLLQERMREVPAHPLVLVLGSSHTEMGVQAARLSAPPGETGPLVFNFGLSTAGPILQFTCLRRLVATGIRPRLLLLEVFPLIFNQPGERSVEDDWWLRGRRLSLTELLWQTQYHNEPSRLVKQWFKWRVGAGIKHRGALCQYLVGKEMADTVGGQEPRAPLDSHGYVGHFANGIDPGLQRAILARMPLQYSCALGSFRLAQRPARALEDMLVYCRAEHIPAVLLLMPEGTGFHELYGSGVRAGTDAFLAELTCRHGVRLIDTRDWIDDTDFWDTHHLLPNGARRFTERLGREVLPELLSENR